MASSAVERSALLLLTLHGNREAREECNISGAYRVLHQQHMRSMRQILQVCWNIKRYYAYLCMLCLFGLGASAILGFHFYKVRGLRKFRHKTGDDSGAVIMKGGITQAAALGK